MVREQNPFSRPQPPRREQRGVFETRLRPLTPAQAEVEQQFRARERETADRPHLEHVHSVTHLYEYLEQSGRKEACANLYSCDPWKYEPLLLDDLIKERAGTNDPDRLNELRGLIRAGSWMTYGPTKESGVRGALSKLKLYEEQDWLSRIRRADPDTSKEYREGLNEEMRDLDLVARALDDGWTGDKAEDAVRVIENVNASLWLEIKKILAAHGLPWQESSRNKLTKPLYDEIERIRALRDFLYFRRLYPKRAKEALPEKTIRRAG